jgi:Protein of unknown function (DUF4019)
MKYLAIVVFAALVYAGAPVRAQDAASVAQAQNAAAAWLALTDAGLFSRSWDESASFFQSTVSKSKWSSAARSGRYPLGPVEQRTLKSAIYTRTLPGAPDGEYVVIKFESRFERRPYAIETITPTREKDGSWRVSGYFIGP